jgi:hypothetical protein
VEVPGFNSLGPAGPQTGTLSEFFAPDARRMCARKRNWKPKQRHETCYEKVPVGEVHRRGRSVWGDPKVADALNPAPWGNLWG